MESLETVELEQSPQERTAPRRRTSNGSQRVLQTKNTVNGEFTEEYIRQLSLGDSAAERRFVLYFGDLLRIRLHSQFRDAEWTEDVRQETLFRVLRTIRMHPATIEHPQKLGSYVHSVCRHVVMERFRGEGRYIPGDPSMEVHDPGPGAEGQLLTAEKQAMVRRLLDEMSPKDRAILTEVFMEERDKDEICLQNDVDRGYLRVLVFRARQRFRDLLGSGN